MTSDLRLSLIRHQPIQIMVLGGTHTQRLECQGRGCFFLTRGGDQMWEEFAHHQADMIELEAN